MRLVSSSERARLRPTTCFAFTRLQIAKKLWLTDRHQRARAAPSWCHAALCLNKTGNKNQQTANTRVQNQQKVICCLYSCLGNRCEPTVLRKQDSCCEDRTPYTTRRPRQLLPLANA